MKHIKKTIKIGSIGLVIILLIDLTITHKAKPFVFDTIDDLSANKVGLVLGAGKHSKNGHINLYYKYRLEATIQLYKAGKIEFILVSGDNGRKDYDEPTDFKEDLIQRGIPANKIYLDYAGFRTLDSIVRAKKVFGLSQFTIISQKFHNERALFLAKHHDLNTIAFNAKDIKGKYGIKTKLRESLARTKAVFDVLFNIKPKYLGKTIEIV
ncbi:SanA/YdcF family protein [Hyunsoonleella ulvae]|uniref:SanA/YdcF family protein n=1 Tax=Hyunsoonleella ulvae TaxID=2799948 RepID=UPI0019397576|nr:ElyC/SanA/YdcF family protein [Hyunsoonleella ulvae]